MKTENKKQNVVNPQRLRDARLSTGMSISEVAEKVHISRQILSQYELGNHKITLEVLLKVQSLYGLPINYYYKPYNNEIIRSQEYFRSFSTATKTKRNIALIYSKWFTEEIFPLIQSLVKFPEVDSLFKKIRESEALSLRTNRDMEALSRLVRRSWGLGKAPISNLTRELEKRGVIIAFLPLDEKLDAFSFWANNRPYIFLSNKTNAVRGRMSIAHELCHLFFHDTEDIEANLKELEGEAKRFAGAFLMPRDGFAEDVYSSSLNNLLILKQKWLTSVAAMVVRCEHINIVTEEKALYLNKEISRRRWRSREPFDDEIPIEHPILMKQALHLILSKGIRSGKEILKEMGLNAEFIEQTCQIESGFLSRENTLVDVIR